MPWVARYPNLVVLRTFSKCAALAGLRCAPRAGRGVGRRGLHAVVADDGLVWALSAGGPSVAPVSTSGVLPRDSC